MNTRLACLAACAAAMLAAGAPTRATAQSYYSGPASSAVLPPHEILTIVRSVGLEPLGRPVRSSETYGLRAVSPAGQVVYVTVHARMGRILRVAATPRAAGLVPSPIPSVPAGAMSPDGYGPNSRVAAYPPDMDDDVPYPERTERSSDWSAPPAPVRTAKPTAAPLPRARPAASPVHREADAAAAPSRTPRLAPSLAPGPAPSSASSPAARPAASPAANPPLSAPGAEDPSAILE